MKIFISDNYDTMSKQAADDLATLLQPLQKPLVSPASGDSPAGLYKQIVQFAAQGQLNVAGWHFVALDEWVGMNGDDEGSCRFHLNNQFFKPLNIEDEKICFFDGRAEHLYAECDKAEDFIKQHGGIYAAIVGLGLNGHIGMNEPGTSVLSRTHISQLDPMTAQVGQKYFKEARQLSEGVTLGLANVLEARNIFLLVSGRKKAEIVKRMLEAEVSEQLPATLLRKHAGLRIYLDKEAASMIQADQYDEQ